MLNSFHRATVRLAGLSNTSPVRGLIRILFTSGLAPFYILAERKLRDTYRYMIGLSLAAASTAFWLSFALLKERNEVALKAFAKLIAAVLTGLVVGAVILSVIASSDPWFQNQLTEMRKW